MSQERRQAALARAHARAREGGVLVPLYATIRAMLIPLLRVWFRLRVSGAEHVPAEGAAIIAPSHRSFMDAVFVGVATRRHVCYMAKTEIFRGPLGRVFVRLGASRSAAARPTPRRCRPRLRSSGRAESSSSSRRARA
jgi:1-acyl-sn-glycerol-3-phosphate acyltransferase